MSPRTSQPMPQQEEPHPLFEVGDVFLIPGKYASETSGRRFLRIGGEDDELILALPEPVYWNDAIIFWAARYGEWCEVDQIQIESTGDDEAEDNFLYQFSPVAPEKSEWLDALLDFEFDKNI